MTVVGLLHYMELTALNHGCGGVTALHGADSIEPWLWCGLLHYKGLTALNHGSSAGLLHYKGLTALNHGCGVELLHYMGLTALNHGCGGVTALHGADSIEPWLWWGYCITWG